MLRKQLSIIMERVRLIYYYNINFFLIYNKEIVKNIIINILNYERKKLPNRDKYIKLFKLDKDISLYFLTGL